jgi:hypothetical protein
LDLLTGHEHDVVRPSPIVSNQRRRRSASIAFSRRITAFRSTIMPKI